MSFNELFIETNLPQSLTKEEIYFYIEKAQKGDLKAREYVIIHHIRFVQLQVYNRFANTPYEKQELVSVGLIGLIKSVDTFDSSKNYEFKTYAKKCIDNEILMFMRKGKKYMHDQSLYTPLDKNKDGKEITIEDALEDTTSDFASDYEKTVIQNEIRKIVYDLPSRDREIILLSFGFINDKRYTQSEVAQKLNISQPHASRLIKKILKKIELQLIENGIIDKNSPMAKTKSSGEKQLMIKEKELEKERYMKIFQLMNTPAFENMVNVLPIKEAIIISLQLEQSDGTDFSTESIAHFLGIEQEEVLEMTKKALTMYKENLSQVNTPTIAAITPQSRVRKSSQQL